MTDEALSTLTDADLGARVLAGWQRMSEAVADGPEKNKRLAAHYGVPLSEIEHVRDTRNLIAHPTGEVSRTDLVRAARTIVRAGSQPAAVPDHRVSERRPLQTAHQPFTVPGGPAGERRPVQTAPSGVARLARLNRTAVFLVTLALLLIGLIVGGVVGGLILLLLAACVGALTATTWPVQPTPTRVLRATVLVLLVITAVSTMIRV